MHACFHYRIETANGRVGRSSRQNSTSRELKQQNKVRNPGRQQHGRSTHCVSGASTPVFCGSVVPQNCSRENCRWEYEGRPYWDGEVDCCINAWTVANGVWLDVCVDELADWFVRHQLPDGGWNCEWIEGSTRSSFHSTLNSLKGLLAYEIATGGTDETRAARRSGEEYLLQRGLFRRLSTCEPVGPWVGRFAYPFRWRYNVLNAADYFREASLSDGNEPDPRMADAIEMTRARSSLGWDVAPGRSPTGAGVVRGRHKGGGAVEVADFVRHPSARLVGSIPPLGCA